jgi:hypothetical protein
MTQLDRRLGQPNPYEQCVPAKMLGQSPQIQSVRSLIRRGSETMSPVLILGESGTGKELVARAIHDSGARRGKPIVPVDCAALASSLFESELFGHIKGAFTGAGDTKHGLLKVGVRATISFHWRKSKDAQSYRPSERPGAISLPPRAYGASARPLFTASSSKPPSLQDQAIPMTEG